MEIILDGQVFHCQITKKSVRNLSLRLKSADSLVISCPRLTPDFVVKKFIQDHRDWIVKHSSKFIAKQPINTVDKLSILGNQYQLIIRQSPRDSVVIFEANRQIYVNSQSLTDTHLRQLIDRKLRVLALRFINQRLRQFTVQFDLHYNHVSVRNQQSRFGSCSSTNNLNFNWQIILLPQPIFDHILLHELTHTLVKNHSTRFWRQLSQYDPQYLVNRAWLKRHASNTFLL